MLVRGSSRRADSEDWGLLLDFPSKIHFEKRTAKKAIGMISASAGLGPPISPTPGSAMQMPALALRRFDLRRSVSITAAMPVANSGYETTRHVSAQETEANMAMASRQRDR